MRPVGFILSLGVLTMLCGSCEQQQVVPPPLPIRTAAACAFDASTVVVELSDQSDPAGYGECAWRSGQCLGQPAKAANPTIPADRMRFIQGKIQDAFDNAPAPLYRASCAGLLLATYRVGTSTLS